MASVLDHCTGDRYYPIRPELGLPTGPEVFGLMTPRCCGTWLLRNADGAILGAYPTRRGAHSAHARAPGSSLVFAEGLSWAEAVRLCREQDRQGREAGEDA